MNKEKALLVLILALILVFTGLIVFMKSDSDSKLAIAYKQIELIKAASESNQAARPGQIREMVYSDMRETFRVKLIEIVRTMQPKLDTVIATKIVKYIVEESESKGLDPVLIAALMWTESRFDPFARSKKNAVGLMQVRYSVWKKTPVMLKNGARKEGGLFWIDINIKVGTGIFKEYYDKSNHDIAKTLWRYNSGQSKLPKGKRAYEIKYVNKVLLKAYEIKEMLKDVKPNEKVEEEDGK